MPAQMVGVEPGRERPAQQRVGNPVGNDVTTVDPEAPVARLVPRSQPGPASIPTPRAINLREEIDRLLRCQDEVRVQRIPCLHPGLPVAYQWPHPRDSPSLGKGTAPGGVEESHTARRVR